MKENFVTDAINLNSFDYGENDRIITVYSKSNGLLKCMAKGCKKIKSKTGGRLQPFVANTLVLAPGKNFQTICSADALNPFLKLRADFDKIIFSSYCCEIVENFGNENDCESEDVFSVLYSCLNALSSCENKIQTLLTVLKFQLKIFSIFGYEQSLSTCPICGNVFEDEFSVFSSEHGGCICEKHGFKGKKIHPKIRRFLIAMFESDFSFDGKYDKLANEKVCTACFSMLDNTLHYLCPKKFKTTEMLYGIL